ncbi:MAG TPA: o-succinylbenzoate synthase [Opitutaceae bacterium]
MDFAIEFRRYRLPFRQPVVTARGTWTVREGVFIRLSAADGFVGYGEAAPVPHFGRDSVDRYEEACRALGGRIQSPEQVPASLASLRGAIASAMRRGEPNPRHRSLAIAALLPAGRAALKVAAEKAEAGYRVFKWKVGVGAADDELAIMDDILGGLPGGSRLRLDANRAWPRRTAERWLSAASERPVEFVEEPVSDEGDFKDLLLGLSRDYPVPLGLDESISSDADVADWLGRGWKGFFVIKTALFGDVDAALELLRVAQARVVFSSALETALGARDALLLAFSWAGRAYALGYGAGPLFVDSRFDAIPPAPLLRHEDASRISKEPLWNAVT